MLPYGLIKPLLFQINPEQAHALAIRSLKWGLAGKYPSPENPALKTRILGLDFDNPVGLAAGFDKNAEVANAMLDQGFGFVEIGTVTPKPQPGNAKPRLFRLNEDAAVINRLGFNNKGMEFVEQQLKTRRKKGILGVNIGPNKESENRMADYVTGIRKFSLYADYFTVNISSPNTPGLRALQSGKVLEDLVGQVMNAVSNQEKSPPVLLKIAPDLTEQDRSGIAEIALGLGLDGLIISNTTIERPDGLTSRQRQEAGGLSGKPLFAPSTALLADMYKRTGGKIPLIGVGGVFSGHDAYAKIRAGASLIQIYTALIYEGPGLAARICLDLADCLKRDGFTNVSDAVGADHR